MIVLYNGRRYSVVARERCLDGLCTMVEVDTTVPATKIVPCRNVEWPAKDVGPETSRPIDNKLGIQRGSYTGGEV